MLVVQTYITRSSIHGLGIFSAQRIAKGELVWMPGYEHAFTEEQFLQLPQSIQNIVTIRGWKDKTDSLYYLSIDNDQFVNHSDNANTICIESGQMYAARDILIGEELTMNYYDFDLLADVKLGKKK